MLEINVRFQEEYLRLDSLCRDFFESKRGVSLYIEHMESTEEKEWSQISGWESDLRALKRMRHIRNKLAHEVDALNKRVCSERDISWIKNFYIRIMDETDPLTRLSDLRNQSFFKRLWRKIKRLFGGK
ncbi:MAG: hypothetical protein IJD42_01505 [Clostridia bacterium]|nr:hypothetical protein [Clostridia bacterium]